MRGFCDVSDLHLDNTAEIQSLASRRMGRAEEGDREQEVTCPPCQWRFKAERAEKWGHLS